MKFRIVFFSSFLALFSMTFAAAQSNVTIGVRGGLNVPGLTGGNGDPVSEGYSTTTRLGAAVFAEFKLSDLFSIQPMLEYSQEGAKRNGMQALIATASDAQLSGMFAPLAQLGVTAPEYLYANAKRTAKMDYLMLPVLAKFGWNLGQNSPWRLYVDAGPYAGLLVNAKNIVSLEGSIYADKSGTPIIPNEVMSMIPPEMLQQITGGLTQISNSLSGTQDIKDQLHKFNWGLEGNVGIQYQANRNRIFLEAGGNYGLMNIQKSTGNGLYLNGKNHIGALTVMLGYGYTL